MMKSIFVAVAIVLTFSGILPAQTLVSATFLGEKTKAELLAEFDNLPFIQFGAKYYQILYTTHSVQGAVDTASGLLAVPSAPNRIYPRLVYQHGTSGSRQDVPSINVLTDGEGIVGQLFAGLGYVAFLPDYLGLGNTSKGFHPYVHAESEAWAAMDMLRAGEEFLADNQVLVNNQMFITGYSQGGHGAMALHRAMEQDPDAEFVVTAASPMSGPYSVSGVMRDLILTDSVYFYPAYIPNTALSYQTVYGNLFQDLTEIFKPLYADLIQSFYDGQITLSQLNVQLIAALVSNEGSSRPFRMLQPAMVAEIGNNPNHPINLALADNDTYDQGWVPAAPMRLLYCMADDQVPFRNSLVARDSLMAVGAPNFEVIDVLPTADHGACYVPAMTGTLVFFLGFQQIETVGTQMPEALQNLRIFPNPAKEWVQVSGVSTETRYEIVDFSGRILQSGTLVAGDHSIALRGLSEGVYGLRCYAEGAVWVEKLVLGL